MSRHAPTLDGRRLVGAGTSEFEVTPIPIEQATPLAGGTYRLQGLYWGAGMPDRKMRHEVRIAWAHLRTLSPSVPWILSQPGAHEWCFWDRVYISYAGDGSRREWSLPWPLAESELGTPTGVPAADLLTQASTTPTDPAELAVEVIDAATYGAGEPAAGELWIDHETRVFKLEAALAPGAVLYLGVVPLLRMVEISAEPRRPGFVRDPLALRLGEVSW